MTVRSTRERLLDGRRDFHNGRRGAPRLGRGAHGYNDRTNVLFVNTATLPPLGADTWVHTQVMRKLDRQTHELHVACATGPVGALTPTYRVVRTIPDLHVVAVDFGTELSHTSKRDRLVGTLQGVRRSARSLARLARYIRRRKISVIYTSDRPRDAVASLLLARVSGIPCIVHVHVAHSTWMSRPLRWAMRHADALIAVSGFVAKSLIDAGHHPDRVHVVHNAIDLEQWQPGVGRSEVRRELGIPDGAPVVVTVCRLFPEKGPAELIKSCAALREDFPDIRLVIAGIDVTPDHRFSDELDGLVADLSMGDSVTFAGQRDDIPRLMAAADVFAMPSFDEPFGLVYLEAMAMERPVIALDNGGTPEVVSHGCTGLLSSPGDLPGLTANLRSLLSDPARRDEIGTNGRLHVSSTFTVERHANGVADVFACVRSPQARNLRHQQPRSSKTEGVGNDDDRVSVEFPAVS